MVLCSPLQQLHYYYIHSKENFLFTHCEIVLSIELFAKMYPIRSYPCDICQKHNYTDVLRQKHKARHHYCYICKKFVLHKRNHPCTPMQQGLGSSVSSPFKMVQAGLDTFRVYSTIVKKTYYSIEKLITKYKVHITNLLTDLLSSQKTIKARIVINTILIQQRTGEEKEQNFGTLYSKILNPGQINKFLFEQVSKIINRLNFYNTGGSSWSVHSLPRIDIHIAKYTPLKVGSVIPTPSCYRNKHGLINIPTEEKLCFAYCAIACYKKLSTVEEGTRMRQYTEFMARNYNFVRCSMINFTCLPQTGLVSVEDIDTFEKHNPTFSVNIFGHCEEEKTIFPKRLCKLERQNHMDLLLVTDVQNDRSHYIYIYDFDKLMKKKNSRKKFFCKRCLQAFATVDLRLQHSFYCAEHPPQRLVFPSMRSVNYTIGSNEISHTYWVCADFETIMTVRLLHVFLVFFEF